MSVDITSVTQVVISAGVALVGLAVGWTNLNSQVDVLEQRVVHVEEVQDKFHNMSETLVRMEEQMKYLRREVNKLNKNLSRGNRSGDRLVNGLKGTLHV